MKILKGYIRNRYRPEACIIENYVAEEIVEFYNKYLHNINPIEIPIDHTAVDKYERGITSGKSHVVDINMLRQAHSYVLHNSVVVDSYIEEHYFGVIKEIWELDYISFCIPLFKCLWIDSNGGSKIDEMGFTLVNFNRIGHKDDCFILANQAK
ncbi:hypothetical protein AXF42_Ash016578 [Apostasia shenzhenica]|uniref:DUF4218 domain-containing protein n=1 Tax=Apostasia shenzhenica TaxID=1088818 RepID=A0A2I0A1H4_9ASPA|nr:hypothetical protein AXF42_Ash016578 [Apostasia shenzhenica]